MPWLTPSRKTSALPPLLSPVKPSAAQLPSKVSAALSLAVLDQTVSTRLALREVAFTSRVQVRAVTVSGSPL